MSIIDEIKKSWGWIGIQPEEVVGENDFGNLIVKDTGGVSIGAYARRMFIVRLLPKIEKNLISYHLTKSSWKIGTCMN